MYSKLRPIEERFKNVNTWVELKEVDAVLSERETDQVLRFCKKMGMDYGELDVLRDRGDGRIYVVDANSTPAARPSGLPSDHAAWALQRMAHLFERTFV